MGIYLQWICADVDKLLHLPGPQLNWIGGVFQSAWLYRVTLSICYFLNATVNMNVRQLFMFWVLAVATAVETYPHRSVPFQSLQGPIHTLSPPILAVIPAKAAGIICVTGKEEGPKVSFLSWGQSWDPTTLWVQQAGPHEVRGSGPAHCLLHDAASISHWGRALPSCTSQMSLHSERAWPPRPTAQWMADKVSLPVLLI